MSPAIQVCLVVYCALFLNFFLVGSITPLVPRLAEEHGMSDYERSVIMSAKSFAHMAVSPVIALLSSKLPVRGLFCFGVFCIAGTYTGLSLATSVTGFVIARAVQGIGVSSIMIAGMSILIMVVPREKRGKYTSFAYSALGHSTLISPLLSGVMYDKLGQLWTFAIPGLATVVAGVVSIMVLSRLMISDDQRVPIPGPRQMLISAKSILLYPLSFVALVGIFSAGVSFGCFEVTVPPILADRLDVIKTNLMWSIGPLVFTVIAPLLGMLIDKIGPFLPFVTGVALYAVFYPFVYLMQDSLGGIGAVIAVMFGIEAILEMSVYPIMAAIVDARKPVATLTVAYSLNEVFIQAGYAIGNLVGVAIYEWRGLQALGYLLGPSNALLALVSIVVLKLFAKNKPDDLPLVDNKLPLSGAHSEA